MKTFIYTGKGGVGKSTVSTISAIKKADAGYKTHLISLDPAHNLHDIFDVSLKEKPKKVLPNLYISETSTEYWETKYLEQTKEEYNSVYKYKQAINIEKYFNVLKYSPGIEEYSLLLAMENAIMNSHNYDFLIIDTPPTALTLKILGLPSMSLLWLESLLSLRNDILKKKNIKNNILGTKTISGKNDPILERLDFLKKRYKNLQDILSDKSKTSLNIVMNPDSLSLSESKNIDIRLKDLGYSIDNVYMNKMNDSLPLRDPFFTNYPPHFIPVKETPPDSIQLIRDMKFTE